MADDPLSLSDEAFLALDPAAYAGDDPSPSADTADLETDSSETSEEEAAADTSVSADSEAQEEPGAATDDDEVGQPDGDTQTELETSSESDSSESPDTSKPDSTDTKGDTPETTEFDYKSAYEAVSKPFKANGVDMQVTDPADIVRLMQMGANYQKKMATLKPNLKLVKMLSNNGLLDEGKLSHLIDLSKKDPKAIAKLIKESGIDPLDIDAEGSADYRPTDHSVTDKEYNLDQVLEGIKDTPTFSKTIGVLTTEWDAASKATISDNPEIIGIINTHMDNGVFDKVNAAMQQDRTLGKLANISDVDAYQQVAERLFKEGALRVDATDADATSTSSDTDTTSQAAADRAKARKAVAPVKKSAPVKTDDSESFLGLSDADFMAKHAPNR